MKVATVLSPSPRLTLRPFDRSDLDVLAELGSNPDFMRFSGGLWSREQAAELLERRFLAPLREGKPSQFGVIDAETNRLIGYCGFFVQEVDGVEELEIGYRLHPQYWGRGIATEAARAVRDHGFAEHGLDRVISLIHPDNVPSRRVAEKNGMRLEKETVFRGFPTQVFSIGRKTWENL